MIFLPSVALSATAKSLVPDAGVDDAAVVGDCAASVVVVPDDDDDFDFPHAPTISAITISSAGTTTRDRLMPPPWLDLPAKLVRSGGGYGANVRNGPTRRQTMTVKLVAL